MKIEITGEKMRQLFHCLWGINSMYLFYDGYDWERDWDEACCDDKVKSLQMLADLVIDERMKGDLVSLVHDLDSFETKALVDNRETAKFYADIILKKIEKILNYVEAEEKNEQE